MTTIYGIITLICISCCADAPALTGSSGACEFNISVNFFKVGGSGRNSREYKLLNAPSY